jgi:hypothetical protein
MLADMEDPAIQAILDAGRKTRKQLPRGLWVVSIAIAAVCVIALAIGLYQSWDVKPLPRKGSAAPR